MGYLSFFQGFQGVQNLQALLILPRRTRHVSIRAKHTTISFFGGYHQLAVWTIQEKQTRIRRHHMRALTLASRTGHGAITLNHLDTSSIEQKTLSQLFW